MIRTKCRFMLLLVDPSETYLPFGLAVPGDRTELVSQHFSLLSVSTGWPAASLFVLWKVKLADELRRDRVAARCSTSAFESPASEVVTSLASGDGERFLKSSLLCLGSRSEQTTSRGRVLASIVFVFHDGIIKAPRRTLRWICFRSLCFAFVQ
jgi:hypothetical protein